MKYRKKLVIIDAIQWDGENLKDVAVFIDQECLEINGKNGLVINTLEGDLTASIGDFIIKGGKGEFWPVREDIFPTLYDKV